jgi:hypothetical protein
MNAEDFVKPLTDPEADIVKIEDIFYLSNRYLSSYLTIIFYSQDPQTKINPSLQKFPFSFSEVFRQYE